MQVSIQAWMLIMSQIPMFESVIVYYSGRGRLEASVEMPLVSHMNGKQHGQGRGPFSTQILRTT